MFHPIVKGENWRVEWRDAELSQIEEDEICKCLKSQLGGWLRDARRMARSQRELHNGPMSPASR